MNCCAEMFLSGHGRNVEHKTTARLQTFKYYDPSILIHVYNDIYCSAKRFLSGHGRNVEHVALRLY